MTEPTGQYPDLNETFDIMDDNKILNNLAKDAKLPLEFMNKYSSIIKKVDSFEKPKKPMLTEEEPTRINYTRELYADFVYKNVYPIICKKCLLSKTSRIPDELLTRKLKLELAAYNFFKNLEEAYAKAEERGDYETMDRISSILEDKDFVKDYNNNITKIFLNKRFEEVDERLFSPKLLLDYYIISKGLKILNDKKLTKKFNKLTEKQQFYLKGKLIEINEAINLMTILSPKKKDMLEDLLNKNYEFTNIEEIIALII